MRSFSQCGSNLTSQLYCLSLLPSSHTGLWWFPKLMSYLENSYSSFRTPSVPPLYPGLMKGRPFCCSSQFPSLRPGRWGETQCNPADFSSSGPTCDYGNRGLPSNAPSSSSPANPQKVSSVCLRVPACSSLSPSWHLSVAWSTVEGWLPGPHSCCSVAEVSEATAPSPAAACRRLRSPSCSPVCAGLAHSSALQFSSPVGTMRE